MDDELEGFFTDDGVRVNPDLVPKPGLCITCKHDNDPTQRILCTLNRMDQQDEDHFKCYAYERII
jgi:hypothetical protein